MQSMFSWDNWSFFPQSEVRWNSKLDVCQRQVRFACGFSLVFYILRMPGIFKVAVLYFSSPPFLLFHFRLVFIKTKMKTNSLWFLQRCCCFCQHVKWVELVMGQMQVPREKYYSGVITLSHLPPNAKLAYLQSVFLGYQYPSTQLYICINRGCLSPINLYHLKKPVPHKAKEQAAFPVLHSILGGLTKNPHCGSSD